MELIKYNMQPSDWPVYGDLVMTSPYHDVIIDKFQYVATWLVEHTTAATWLKNKNKKKKNTK